MTLRARHLARMRRRRPTTSLSVLRQYLYGVDWATSIDQTVKFTWRNGKWHGPFFIPRARTA